MKITKPSHWLAALLTLFLPVVSIAGNHRQNLDVLFIANDQGESNAFLQLEKALSHTPINYRIVTLGRATEVFDRNPESISPAQSLKESFKADRNLLLDKAALDKLIAEFNPAIVYTGMASAAQAQLLNAFKEKGSHAIAFYDNFDPIASKDYVTPFLEAVTSVDEFHVPSRATAESFRDLPALHNIPVRVTGQPALEAWDEVYQSTDAASLRTSLNLPASQQLVLFAGGYDDSYETYFSTFIKATRTMPDVSFLITYHPKTQGTLERAIIEKTGKNNVRLIKAGEYSTQSLSTIADAVVVHKSSIGIQALYKHRPVIYVAEEGFDNFLIQKQLAQLASTPDALKQALNTVLKNNHELLGLDALGMPSHPSGQIIEQLQHLLKPR